MTINEIRDAITTLFNFTITDETDEKIVFNIISDKTAILDKVQVTQLIQELSVMTTDQDVELTDNISLEVLVRQENRMMLNREIEQKDPVNKIEYKIDKPTDKYLIFFLSNLAKQNTPRILRSGIVPHRLKRLYDGENSQQVRLFELNILEVIKEIVPRLETLQIKSESSKKKADFEQLVYAFLFNLGYNLDYTIQPLRFMDEFTQPYRLGRLRRSNFSDVEPPKRVYLNELILHYQKGISSESIDHQFLSFYHVLEHFYEKIYNDDILNSIKTELTKPSFSYKRSKDISGLVNLIQSRLKYKNDEFQLNEPEALELTLKKFVKDIPYLASELTTISPTLIEHFKTKEVPFSKGNKVNFENTNTNEVYANLAKRIYLTRNAIVHSKETDKSKYTPFRDDKDLLTEIYLLRLIAEIVIIENSREL
jgi:hypothetical protein